MFLRAFVNFLFIKIRKILPMPLRALALILLSLLSFPSVVYAFDENAANARWLALKGSADEALFLIDLFLTERMPGDFPHLVKQRFGEICSPSDAAFLLEKYVNPEEKSQHSFIYTLLNEINGDEFVFLLDEYYRLATNDDTRHRIFNLITKQNSPEGFRTAINILTSMQTQDINLDSMPFLDYMVRFTHPDIRQDIIDNAFSPSKLIRAASYISLRNYPDEQVKLIIDNALGDEEAVSARSGGSLSVNPEIPSLIDILKTTKREQQVSEQFPSESRRLQGNDSRPDFEKMLRPMSLLSSDEELAKKFAPEIRLSGPGGVGVNIKDEFYPYSDYIPVAVDDVTSNIERQINLFLNKKVEYQGKTYGPGNVPLDYGNFGIGIIGDQQFRSALNYLDFSPLWPWYTTKEAGYKTLKLHPTVYFRVFRNHEKRHPIAIQYWFFYVYNDWFSDHPGDWETITVFLNDSVKAIEATYSTHYEANRHSWQNITVAEGQPVVNVSNGGHGSYARSDDTSYWGIKDNHKGDKERIKPGDYQLVSLHNEEELDDSWIWFEGRWGDNSSAPKGPRLRIDAPSGTFLGNHHPLDPYKNCEKRNDARIYGDSKEPGPWYWAVGYGLDSPWKKEADCTRVPAKPTTIAPNSTVTTNQPIYSWNAVNGAIDYLLWVNDATGNKIAKWYPAAQTHCAGGTGTCSIKPAVNLATGNATWWVRGWNPGGEGPWSDGRAFAVSTAGPPGKPTTIAPSGAISTNQPTYSWNAVNTATWYQLWVNDSTGNKIAKWYTATQTHCGGGTGTCSIQPAVSLATGNATWWIQGWNPSGHGPWSDGRAFTVSTAGPPGKPTTIAPSGAITINQPTYSWNAVGTATWYQLWVNDSTGNKIATWYTATQTHCGGGAGTCSIQPAVSLATGNATWWVRGWNPSGHGPWSDGRAFAVSTAGPPGKPTTIAPSGAISTNQPTYSWNAVNTATWYQLWVNDSTGNKIAKWYTATQTHCGGGTGTCSIQPAVSLATGNATWWIQGWNPSGHGPWSDGRAFTVSTGASLLNDNFDNGLSKWNLFGSPKPVIRQNIHGKSFVFDNMGDPNYNSGAVSKQTVGSSAGFEMESDVYVDVTNVGGCWNQATIGLTRQPNPGWSNDGDDNGYGILYSLAFDGDACWGTPAEFRRHGGIGAGFIDESSVWQGYSSFRTTQPFFADAYLNRWTRLRISVSSDRSVRFYADGNLIWAPTRKLHPDLMQGRNVTLGLRSSGSAGKAYHSFVRVTSR